MFYYCSFVNCCVYLMFFNLFVVNSEVDSYGMRIVSSLIFNCIIVLEVLRNIYFKVLYFIVKVFC